MAAPPPSSVTPTLSHKTIFEVSEATVEDASELTDVFLKSHADHVGMRHLMPDTPGLRAWMNNQNLEDISNKSDVTYVVVRDTAVKGEGSKGKIVGYGKWFLPNEDGKMNLDMEYRFPPWAEDSDKVHLLSYSEYYISLVIAAQTAAPENKHS